MNFQGHAFARMQRGFSGGTGGNASARDPGTETMWVKASGGAFWSASDRMFLRADFKGVNLAGTGEVSREALLHGFLYQKLPTIRAILHVHAPYAIAWSATHDRLMRVTLQAGLKLKYDIPVLPIVTPTVGAETLPQVEEMLRSRPGLQAFILKQHGIVAMGTSPLGAEHVAELIEQTAKVAYLEHVLRGETNADGRDPAGGCDGEA